MSKRFVLTVLAVSCLGLAACSKPPQSDIGLIDVQRLTSNWPKFLNYQNQLNSDVNAIQHSTRPNGEKQRALQGLQQRYQTNQTELTTDVRDAAQQVAGDRHLRFVFTRQFVGYGGVDITPDVEKLLKIDDKSTPGP